MAGSSIYDYPEEDQGILKKLGDQFTGHYSRHVPPGTAYRTEGSYIPMQETVFSDQNLVREGAWSILIEYDHMGDNTPTGFFITCVEGNTFLPAAEIIKHASSKEVELLQRDPKVFATMHFKEMVMAAEHHLRGGTALPEEELKAYLEEAAGDEGLTPEQAEVLQSLREDAGCGQID
jgi:hypothetical protein